MGLVKMTVFGCLMGYQCQVMDTELAPLILTADMSSPAQEMFNALRQEHCPERLRQLPAHLTLFHALPGDTEDPIREVVCNAAPTGPLEAVASEVRSLGRGVAYRIESTELLRFRQSIAACFADRLTSQDRSKREFHVTVQNKVEPLVARQLLEELQTDFEPFGLIIEGVRLWRYLGGPWEFVWKKAF